MCTRLNEIGHPPSSVYIDGRLSRCLAPKLELGNAVLEAQLCSFAARRFLHLNRCRGRHLNGRWIGKRSFRSVRSQAGAWERDNEIFASNPSCVVDFHTTFGGRKTMRWNCQSKKETTLHCLGGLEQTSVVATIRSTVNR